jgi:opacity protein-like surface antigen
MNMRILWAAAAGAGLLPGIYEAHAQYLDQRNRFYVGPRLHFNVSADLRNLAAPTLAAGVYDDGYVSEDVSRSPTDTWNWGYQKNDQIVGDTLELHRTDSPRDGMREKLDEWAEYGFEIGYGRELYRFGNAERPFRLGVEGSFSASALEIKSDNTITRTQARRVDRFSLGGIVPPPGPYNGPFEGPLPPNPPAPIIDRNPVGSATEMATVSSRQRAEIDGTYYGFRLGPYLEMPLTGRFALEFGLGLAMVQASGDLSYAEAFQTTGTGGPPIARENKQSSDDWLFGFYTNARLQYWWTDAWGLYLGVEFQALDDLKMTAENKTATVNFGETMGVSLGVVYSF